MYAQLEEVQGQIEKIEDDLKGIREFKLSFKKFELEIPTGIRKALEKRVSKNEKVLDELYIKYDRLKKDLVSYIETH